MPQILGGCNVIGQSEQCRSSLTQLLSGRVARTQRLESETKLPMAREKI
jgi:hypothetical protein